MNKFGAEEIIKLFKEYDKQLNELWCFVEKCCSKIPINIGNGVGLFKRLYRDKWEFKSLIAGDNITITEQDNTITINSTSEGFDCNDLNTCNTDNLPEGATNFYFTDARAISALTGQNISIFNNDAGYITCSDVNSCLTGTPTEVLYYNTLGNVSSDDNFTRNTVTGESLFASPNAFDDGGFVYLTSLEARLGARNSGSQDVYFWSTAANNGFYWNGVNFILPIADGNNGDVLTTNGAGTLTLQPIPSTPQYISAIADTNTVDLTETAGTLTADVNYQNTSTINLSEDASGLKADFASMNISQFTNDSGYTTNTGTVTSVSALTLGTTGTDLSSTVANSTTTPVITLNVPTASASNRGALSSTDWSTFNNKVGGSGTTNEIAYFSGSSTISSLSTGTYPSLTELSYVKGVTGSVQTQLDAKQDLILKASLSSGNVTLTNTLTATDLTGLSFSVAANTRYYIFGQIDCGSANASGIKWAINAPAATTLDVNLFGLTSATTLFRSEMITALTTLTTSSIPAANTTQGFVYLSGTIETGANSGTVQIQWATVSNYTITAYKLGTGLFLIKL